MNVLDFINRKGENIILNPKYDKKKKKNKEPKYISVLDDGRKQDPLIQAANYEAENRITIPSKEVEKYTDYGLNYNPYRNMDGELADAQSNWEKAFNSLGQTIVSEVGIGTVKAFADIFDFVSSSVLGITEDDYQNPVSETLQSWQDKFNEEIAPIYANPELNIQNGGLKDFGWWMKNLPQVASTLTLLIPTKTISTGFSLLSKTKFGRLGKVATRNARRWATQVGKVESANELKAWQIALNNPKNLAKINYGAQTMAEGLLMRTIENYQEARDTHIQTYQTALDKLDGMDDKKIQYWLDSNPELKKEIEDKGIDIKDHDSIAKHIAKKAADRTFSMDFSNAIFDIIQLHSLNNIGAGIKKATGRAVAKAQKESIRAAEEIVTGVATTPEKVGFLSKVGNGVKDFVKYNAKTMLAESTEGIEEAVNYIAQQEGITYGKMLLENNQDVYDYNKFTGIWGSWSNMQGELSTYLKSAELQESAFWGLMGGVIFQGVGDISNKASLALHRKARDKKIRELEEKTGATLDADSKINNLEELFETNEIKAARVTINKRQGMLKQLQQDLKTIKDGNDPFDRDESGKPRKFKGTDIELEQNIAKAKLLNEFKSELALDAINSGTFDLLLDYFQSEQVKKAMVKLGLAPEGNINEYTEDTVKTLKGVKELYDRQSTHIMNQISAINAKKGTAWDAEDIPLEYAQQITFDNVNTLLNIKSIDEQIAATRELARQQEALMDSTDNSEAYQGAAETIRLGSLIDLYSRLDAQERYLKDKTSTDAMESLSIAAQLSNIKNQKKSILKNLVKENNVKGNTPIANIFNAIRTAQTYSYDETRSPNPSERYTVNELFNFEETDADIINESRNIFKELQGEESLITDDVIKTSTQVFNDSLKFYTDIKNGLSNLNPTLFGHYVTLSYLENNKTQLMSMVSSSQTDVMDRVNYYHNMYSKARAKAINKAESIIRNAYVQYEGVEDEGGKPIVDALIEAYKGNKQKAREIAEQYMTNTSGNFVTAAEFLDALDIFNLNSSNNNFLYNWISQVIAKAKQDVRQSRPVEVLENDTNKNNNSRQSNSDLNNNTSEQVNSSNNAPIASERQQININDNRPKKKIKFIINNRGDIIKAKATNNANYDAIAYENEDGTFELDVKSLNKSKQLNYAAKGLLSINDDVDLSDENSKWEITQNPILSRGNNEYNVIEQGIISKVNDGTTTNEVETSTEEEVEEEEEEVDDTSTPVEKVTEEDFNIDVNSFVPFNIGDRVVDGITGNKGEVVNIDGNTYTIKKDDGNTFVVVNPNVLHKEESPTTIPSTGEQVKSTLTKEELETVSRSAFGNFIDNLLDPSINLDEIETKVREQLINNKPSDSVADDQINEAIATIKSELQAAINRFKAFNNPLQQTGAALAYSCRVEELDTTDYSRMFYSSVKDFMEEYQKIILVPKVDGKQVVRLEDILRICNNVYATSDTGVAAHMFEIIKSYFNTKEGKEKYTVIDSYKDKEIFDRINKTSKEIANEYLATNGFRVAINEIFDAIQDPQIREDYLNAFNDIKVGDTLDLLKFDKELVIQSNGTTIGKLPIPMRRNQDTFVYYAGGFITDVKRDGRGNIISRAKDAITELLCDTDKDNDDLRLLLENIRINGGKVDDNAIQEFIRNPLIDVLINTSILDAFNGNNILYVDKKTKQVDVERVLRYLTDLWRYASDSAVGYNTKDRLDEMRISLDRWFNNLYDTYSAISQIEGSAKVEVIKINEGQIIRATDKEGQDAYYEYTTPSEGLDSKLNARISIVDPMNRSRILVSDRTSIYKDFGKGGTTLLTIFSRNAEPDFVNAYGLRLSDFDNASKEFINNIKASCIHLMSSFEAIRTEATNNNEVKNTENIIRNILAITNDYTRIPLLRATDNSVDVRIHPIKYRNDARTGIEIVYTKRVKDGNDKHISVKIFDHGKERKTFGMSITDEINPSNNVTLYSNVNNYNTIAQQAATAFLNKFLVPYFCSNISNLGIRNDYKTDTNFNGYINKKGGKLVVTIPKPDGTTVTTTYDSYNDYLVKGNLIKINTKKNKKGSNFERRGSNQKLNQFLSVSLPVNTNSNKSNINVDSNDKIERTSNVTTFGNLKRIIDNNSSNVGLDILKEVLGEDVYSKFEDVAGKDFLNKIFPSSILYSNKANKKNSEGDWIGDVAKTKIGDGARYYEYEGNTIRKPRIPNSIDTVVGPLWMNMASSNTLFRRQAAIRTLIHEKLHKNIHSLPKEEQIRILDAIEEIYDIYKKHLDKDLATLDPNSTRYKVAAQTKASLRNYTKSTEAKRLVLLEEFLVESLTNNNFFQYLNSIETEDVDNNKKDNLFTKIAKLIAKIFGFEIKDNSLYMKELNLLRDIFQDNNTPASTTEEISSTETATEVDTETTAIENKEEDRIVVDNIEDEEEIIEEGEGGYVEEEIEDEVIEGNENKNNNEYEDEDEDDDYTYDDDEDAVRQQTEEINVSRDGFTIVQSIDGFKDSLPLDVQSQFDAIRDNGLVEFKCR